MTLSSHGLDLSGQVRAWDGVLGSCETSKKPAIQWTPLSHRRVRCRYTCRVYFDQDLVVLGGRFFDLLDLENVWWSVFCLYNCFHFAFPYELTGGSRTEGWETGFFARCIGCGDWTLTPLIKSHRATANSAINAGPKTTVPNMSA